MIWPTKKSQVQQLFDPLFLEKEIQVFMLRDDLLHPGISGNKWRKLKYNLLDISDKGVTTIVTVGGSHSNHIAAVAEAGKLFGFRTIGLIRGYEAYRDNVTLSRAAENGMEIRFFDKQSFNEIETEYVPNLNQEIGDFEFVPLGGGNELGMKGCIEINNDIPKETTHITTACGTGSTMAGIVVGANSSQMVIGFPAMKGGSFMFHDVSEFLFSYSGTKYSNYEIITEYHFGGFAKIKPGLTNFINEFRSKHGFALDGIYNGKMMFGVYDLIRNSYFKKGSVITAIHTGGVQGNLGLMNKKGIILPLS